MAITLIIVVGLLICVAIGFGTLISSLKQATVSTLTAGPIVKALLFPVVWVGAWIALAVTGVAASIAIQIDQFLR